MRKGKVTLYWLYHMAVWLTCIIRMRYHYNRLFFSKRQLFMHKLRPRRSNGVVAYPDAFMMINHTDIIRALKEIAEEK